MRSVVMYPNFLSSVKRVRYVCVFVKSGTDFKGVVAHETTSYIESVFGCFGWLVAGFTKLNARR